MQSQACPLPPNIFHLTAAELIALLQPPKPKPAWTAERDSLALALRKQGLPPKKVARKLGTNYQDVVWRFHRLDVERSARWMKSAAFWTPERDDLVAKLWNDSLSASQISYSLGGGWRHLGQKKELDPTRCAICGKLKRLRAAGYDLRLAVRPHRQGAR